jgi:hypothetical protein
MREKGTGMTDSTPAAAPERTTQKAKPDTKAEPDLVVVRVQQLNSINPLQFHTTHPVDSMDEDGNIVQVQQSILVTADGVKVPSDEADDLIELAASVGVVITRDDAEEAK